MSDVARFVWSTFAAVPLVTGVAEPSLPLPPIPPARTPPIELAPVPDPDAAIPRAESSSRGVTVGPGVFAAPEQFRGDGFSPGSTVQQVQERRLHPPAGVRLSVPIE